VDTIDDVRRHFDWTCRRCITVDVTFDIDIELAEGSHGLGSRG
jgi:hypothetical protein